ncbi:hypothetical protein [Deinococcus sp.]|uniref:hypothetical protein n=1 Tax=Deinococcus sp. TaxID=47478 RepID=UPI003C797714
MSPISDDILTFWSTHNGEDSRRLLGIVPGFVLLSIGQIIEIQALLSGVADIQEEESINQIDGVVLPAAAGKTYVFSPHTQVFAGKGVSDFLVIDYAPGLRGKIEQITHVGRYVEIWYILAADLEEFLELLEQLPIERWKRCTSVTPSPTAPTRYLRDPDRHENVSRSFVNCLNLYLCYPRSSSEVSPHYGLQFNWSNASDLPITDLFNLCTVLYQEGKLYQPSSD